MSAETELELQRAVGRLEGKMDALAEELRDALPRFSKRLAVVESWQARVIGAAAGVSAAVSLGFKLFFSRNQ